MSTKIDDILRIMKQVKNQERDKLLNAQKDYAENHPDAFEALINHIEKAEPSFEERFRWETAARLYTSFENLTQEAAIAHAENLIIKLKETKQSKAK